MTVLHKVLFVSPLSIACVFFLALEKTSFGNCTSYFQTVPN